MTYETAPATELVATHCAVCNRPLVDAESVQTGMGPDCRRKHGFDRADRQPRTMAAIVALTAAMGGDLGTDWSNAVIAGDHRAVCNRLVHRIAAGGIGWDRLPYAVAAIDALGYGRLAVAVSRGLNTVTVEDEGADLLVKTPFNVAFNEACRGIRGSRWDRDRKVRIVPQTSRAGLWQALKTAFPAGTVVLGTKGAAVL